jgi:NAD(P)H dehydrogenase (quinone)
MKYLIIYAHPREDSFNHAILEKVIAKLSEMKHEIIVRDLNKENFNPLLNAADFASFAKREVPADILKEQEFITWSDKIIIIHPIWWLGMPAMMKGYADRILITGFAYKYVDGKPVGLLGNKPLLLINTTGNSDELMETKGIKPVLEKTMDKGIYKFCGIRVEKIFLPAVPYVSAAKRKEYLELIEKYLIDF